MNSTTLTSLVSAIADYFFCALAKTEDFDTFCRDVRAGVNSAAAKAVGICIERFDAEVVARAPSSWAVHGVATRSIITLFGIVSYSRTLLRDEHGRNRYPTDEILGIPARARLSTEAFLWIVTRCATVSFRQAARDFASVSGVEISAMCAWRAVQREGVLIKAYLRALPCKALSAEKKRLIGISTCSNTKSTLKSSRSDASTQERPRSQVELSAAT